MPQSTAPASAEDDSAIEVAAHNFNIVAQETAAWLDGTQLAYTTADLLAMTQLQMEQGDLFDDCGAAIIARAWLDRRAQPYTGGDLVVASRMLAEQIEAVERFGGECPTCAADARARAQAEAEGKPRH